MIGHTEILIISLVVLVLFGAGSIPKFARSLGKARKEFQDGLKDGDLNNETSEKKDANE